MFMKKSVTGLFLAVCLMMALTVSAQQQRSQLAIGLGPNLNFDPGRVGISGYVKWYAPGLDMDHKGLVLTAKATHTPPSEGGFFKVFDGGKYDNITTGHLLIGYRFDFPYGLPTAGKVFYLEPSVGAGLLEPGNVGFSFSPQLGLAFDANWEGFLSYHGSWGSDSRNINLLELGAAYRFKL